jgi:hypothetical protein
VSQAPSESDKQALVHKYLVYWRFYQDGGIECEVRAIARSHYWLS